MPSRIQEKRIYHRAHDNRNPLLRVGVWLRGLHREIERGHLALRVDCVDKRQHRRCLAGLPRGMEDKILLALDESDDTRETRQRRKHVVLARNARPRYVEVLFHIAHSVYTRLLRHIGLRLVLDKPNDKPPLL